MKNLKLHLPIIMSNRLNRDHSSSPLFFRTTKGITTIGEIAILSTSPITQSQAARSTTRRLLTRLRTLRDHDAQRGRRTDRDPPRRNIVKRKLRSDVDTYPNRTPTFPSSPYHPSVGKGSALSSTSTAPRSLQGTNVHPIHGIPDLVFDPFYYTKLALGDIGEDGAPKRPGPLARAPTLEGVSEVDEREEPEQREDLIMQEDIPEIVHDSDSEDNGLLWRPTGSLLKAPSVSEAFSYPHHYEDSFPMNEDNDSSFNTLNDLVLPHSTGFASTSSSRTASPTASPQTTPFLSPFRALDVDMDDDGFGDHPYDTDESDHDSMDELIDVVEEQDEPQPEFNDDSDDEFEDVSLGMQGHKGLSLADSQFLHRTSYETILTSTVHQHLGYMEDGGRVTSAVSPISSYSDDRKGVRTRRAARMRARRGVTYPRRFSSLMGVSLAIMNDRIGLSTGF